MLATPQPGRPGPLTDRRDLDSPGQIHDLVVHFYREVVFDDLLEPVFGEVAEVDWALHIPHLIDYWCRVLLGEARYEGFILRAHQRVHDLEPLRLEHFDRWYGLWVASIDSGWAGPVADRAKAHAAKMARILAHRVLGAEWGPPEAGDGPR
jgi:hemoglobin